MNRAKVTEEGVTDTRGPGGEPGLWAETACAESRSRRAPGLTDRILDKSQFSSLSGVHRVHSVAVRITPDNPRLIHNHTHRKF